MGGGGGGKISSSLPDGGRSSPVVSGEQLFVICQTHSGEVEHCGRSSQSATHGVEHRMDSIPQGPQEGVGDVLQADGGSFCHSVQQETPSLCLSSPRPSGLGDRCPVHSVVGTGGVCLSPVPHHLQGSEEGKDRSASSATDSPQVASAALVSRATRTEPKSPSASVSNRRGSGTAAKRHPSRKRSKPRSSRLGVVRESLSSLGASPDTLDFVSKTHRDGTLRVYDSKWKLWLSWCKKGKVDPLRPSAVSLANFLANLGTKGRRVGTVKSYLSTIRTSLK